MDFRKLRNKYYITTELKTCSRGCCFSYNKYLLSTGFETTSRYLDQSSRLCCL